MDGEIVLAKQISAHVVPKGISFALPLKSRPIGHGISPVNLIFYLIGCIF